MEDGRASETALWVAVARALGDRGHTHVPGFSDPFAHAFLDPRWRRRADRCARLLDALPRRLRRRLIDQIDVLPLRVTTIDRALDAAVGAGARQVVLLGAGLDSRAWRLDALRATPVFEVDHPATQAAKRRAVADTAALAREVRFVPVDFERDDLGAALAAAGHDATQPTVWVWEGVVMYLTDAALRATLDVVGARSAAGSTLVVNYQEPGAGQRTLMARALFAWFREPLVGLRTRHTLRDELARVGFSVIADVGGPEQAAAAGAPPTRSWIGRVSRVAVATRS